MILATALLILAVQDPQDQITTPPAWRPALVTVTAHQRTLDLATPAGPVVVQLDSLLLAHRIDTVQVLSAVPDRTGKQVFVLLNVHGWSRGPESAMGMCGAGEEMALVWLTVPMVAPPQVVPYASCFLSREGELNADADSLWGTVEDYAKKVRLSVVFRIQQADSGLRISQEPSP